MKIKLILGVTFVALFLLSAPICWARQNSSQQASAQINNNTEQQANEYFQKQEWLPASREYEKLTAEKPTNGRAWYRLGYARHSIGQYSQAIDAFKKCVQIGNNPLAIYNIACCYAKMNDVEQALDWLDKAVKTGYIKPQQLKSDEDLVSLGSNTRFKEIVEQSEKSAFPCKYVSEHRQFDFWVGEWVVQDPKGQVVGKNEVKLILDECVLFENWTGSLGGQGKSLNFYNSTTNKWCQTWVDDKGGILELSGEYKDGVMKLVGENNQGAKVLTHLTFTKISSDRVHQVWEQSTDNGNTWVTLFDGMYIRRTDSASNASQDKSNN